MSIRAVIFDVYGTLLEIEDLADAEERWHALFVDMLETPPPFGREEFTTRFSQVISRHHADARARGVEWPEVVWPAVLAEVLPGLTRLSAAETDDFVFRQMQVDRRTRLAAGAGECLRWLRDRNVLLGIASNAQAYTLRVFAEALRGEGLDLPLFDPELRFWSFQHGFSKPDPQVFRILSARLEARGIGPAETLMVGDNLDNDVLPALAHGWQAWHLRSLPSAAVHGGGFQDLMVDETITCLRM